MLRPAVRAEPVRVPSVITTMAESREVTRRAEAPAWARPVAASAEPDTPAVEGTAAGTGNRSFHLTSRAILGCRDEEKQYAANQAELRGISLGESF